MRQRDKVDAWEACVEIEKKSASIPVHGSIWDKSASFCPDCWLSPGPNALVFVPIGAIHWDK